jgi:hypothetical protein
MRTITSNDEAASVSRSSILGSRKLPSSDVIINLQNPQRRRTEITVS